MLKECSSEIAPILAYIYNESLAQGNVPDDWRQTDVIIMDFAKAFDKVPHREVQVGKDQEKAQSEKDSHSKKPRWEKTKLTIRYLYYENIS